MALLLALETSTKNCSVALFKNDNLLQLKEHVSDKYMHSEQLVFFIEQVLIDANTNFEQLDVIALGKGPGSYTGLRIGTSTAFGVIKNEKYKFYCPMLDARRMEVFASIYDNNNQKIRKIRAEVVDKNTYSDFLKERVLFFGDGASKCKLIINHENAFFLDHVFPSAQYIGPLALKKFSNKDFEDIAYYEPYYLKDFVPGGKNNI